MNRATIKQQNLRNSEQLNKFYLEVLSSFIFRLYKDYRYKSTVQEDQISNLEKLVKAKIQSLDSGDSKSLFDIYLKRKQTSKDFNDLQVQSNFSRDKTVYSEIKVEDTKKNPILQTNQHCRTEEEEEQIDDLADYKEQPVAPKELYAKKQYPNPNNQEPKQSKQEANHEPKQAQDSQSDSESINLIDRAQQKIGTAIMGTFSPLSMKRRPKQQKIFLQLQNVFIKYANSPSQNFFAKIVCELSKIEKQDIKELKK